MTLEDIEAAAFWDNCICVDCGTVQVSLDEPPLCLACNSSAVLPAELLLKINDFIEREET